MYHNTTLNASTTTQLSQCVDSGYIPSSRQFFQDLSQVECGIIIVCCLLTLITAAVYTEHVHFLLHFKDHWVNRRFSVWILGVLPVTGVSTTLNLCLPRLAAMSDLLSSIAWALGVLHFKMEVLDHFGDVDTVVRALKSVRIHCSTSPCCFPRSCCPPFQLTRCRYRLITCCVLQAAIVQPLTAILSLALFMENGYHYRQMNLRSPDFYITVVRCVSTLLGVYGLCLAVAATEPVWKPLDVSPKCAVLVAWLSLFNFQGLAFGLLIMHDIPSCTGHLSSRVRGKAITDMLLLLEMLLMAVLTRYFYHNLGLNLMDRAQCTISNEPGWQEMSGIHDRSPTDSIDTGTDVWTSPGLTDSSLFLTDSSETAAPERECLARRTVITNYGTIAGPSDAQISQEDAAAISCEDMNISLKQTTDQQE